MKTLYRSEKDEITFTVKALNFLGDFYIKFRETELVEISQLNRVLIDGSLPMQECIDESAINDYQRIQASISNNKFINGILEGYAWPGLTERRAKTIGMVFEKTVSKHLQNISKSVTHMQLL